MERSSFEQARGEMLERAREGIKSARSSEEFALIQAINAYNETSKSGNLAFERLGEWFGLYFPDPGVNNPKTLAKLALALSGSKEASKEEIASVLKDEKRASEIYARATSMGREMSERERSAMAGFASHVARIWDTLDGLESYIKKVSADLMPNTVHLTDDKIAAELLSKAGSMERLATMPASTIQLLGAEKSLFKHLKFGSKPPKYGILFKMPEVSGAARDQRGRIARLYATKICMALKADYFTKRFIADKLEEDIKKGIKFIRQSKPRKGAKPSHSTQARPERHTKGKGQDAHHGRARAPRPKEGSNRLGRERQRGKRKE